MSKKTTSGIMLVFPPEEQDTADMIGVACDKAISLIRENWGLEPPSECYIHVMNSPLGFFFQSAPWPWRIMLGATVPLWFWRVRRTWPYSAAWTQKYGRKLAIGVKPPHLWEQSNRSIGQRLFVEEKNGEVNIQNVTCHELVHACSAFLRLPAWLNEGMAVVTTDRFIGRPVVRAETLALMKDYAPKAPPPTYRGLSRLGKEAIAYHGVRGYWIVRYVEEKLPGFLKSVFSLGQDGKMIEQNTAAELGMKKDSFWSEIDDAVVNHFESQSTAK